MSRNRRSLVRLAGAALLVAAILVGVSAFRLSSGTDSRGGAEGAAPTEVAASTDVAPPTGVDPRAATAEPADAIAAAYAAACLGAAAPTVVGCGSGAIQSSPGSPETAAPDSPNELVLVTSQTVAAGGQATVPLQFEGSATAAVIVVSQSASISASLGSATFVTSTFLDGSPLLAATVTSPADQPLILRNQGTTAQTVGVFVSITTARHLSVSAGSHFVHPGSALSVDVRLSSSVGNEVPSAAIVDGSGNRTTIPLTSAGTGHWTGQIASPPPGLNRIIAWTSQNGLRLAGDIVEVSSGGATLDGTFGEQLTGTEDGLADALVLSPRIKVTIAGEYRVAADLLDRSGTRVGSANGRASLAVGTQTLDLVFDGATIYKGGESGPYRLANVTLAQDTGSMSIEDQRADMGLTHAYDVRSFQHFPILFDRTAFSDQAVDTNGDGTYDVLHVRGSVTVDTAGRYQLSGRLIVSDGNPVAEFSATPTFAAGANSFDLAFDGQQIVASLRDGPYMLTDLYVNSVANSDVYGYLISAYTTGPYKVAQFRHPAGG